MTKEEFWQAFMNEELAIYTPSQKEYDSLMQFFHLKKLKWINGKDAAFDDRHILETGAYIMATQEQSGTCVLISEEDEKSLADEVIVSTYYVLGNLFRKEIDEIETKLTVPINFIFQNILGHKIYEYDRDLNSVRRLRAIDLSEKDGSYSIKTNLFDLSLEDLNKTWFLNKADALKCCEDNAMVSKKQLLNKINSLANSVAENFERNISSTCLNVLCELKAFINEIDTTAAYSRRGG